MKAFTVRFAHLESLPEYKKSDVIFRGDKIGRMGSSGQSKHPHLHIDVVESLIDRIIRLRSIGYESQSYEPNIEQLNHFIDSELFDTQVFITSYFYDPDYKKTFGKDHPAYDVVPKDRHETKRHFDIFWNRTKSGIILNVGFDEIGYGNYILIGFEA